jgi:hypothetical protein
MLPASTSPIDVAQQLLNVASLGKEPWQCAWSTRHQHHPATIRFYRPSRTLPISLTGTACALQCAHCRGVYLQHMHPVDDIPSLRDRATSFLISGGCDPQGRVPVHDHLQELAHIHATHRLNWHVGLVDEAAAAALAPLADVISFDIVGDRETARAVYGLDLGLEDYMAVFDLLQQHATVVPHITVGLEGGRLRGERAALAALADRQVERVILIILIPTAGTDYENCPPPDLLAVADLFLWARQILPAAELVLGCMRPHGAYRQAVDQLAVRAGFNGLVNPSKRAEQLAVDLGLALQWGDECCALN